MLLGSHGLIQLPVRCSTCSKGSMYSTPRSCWKLFLISVRELVQNAREFRRDRSQTTDCTYPWYIGSLLLYEEGGHSYRLLTRKKNAAATRRSGAQSCSADYYFFNEKHYLLSTVTFSLLGKRNHQRTEVESPDSIVRKVRTLH